MNHKGNILIVDDTNETLTLLTELLNEECYIVFSANSGELALELIEKVIPDLILLDIRMPGMDGFEVCRHLKSNPEFANIPIIFLSNSTDIQQCIEGLKLGAVDFINKPFFKEELILRVKTHLDIFTLNKILKEQTHKLQEKNEEYETINEELRQTNNELLIAKEKAEESNLLKNTFLQNMSHEVRTPLNAISGFSQLITKPNQPTEKLKKFSEMILDGSEKLIRIITDVIEISQIHTRQVETFLKEMDIISFIYCIANVFKEKAKEKRITLVVKMNIPYPEYLITSDKGKLERIFNHLIDNAIKFTEEGLVVITCELEYENIKISISDTGIGISDEMQKIIFEPFRQVESGMARNYGGNGLGLPIAKAYIELLNGSITVKSELSIGTTFFVSIPANIADNQVNQHTKEKRRYSIHTILIAEDEYSNYEYLLELLEETNLKILLAKNGQQAIDLCRTHQEIDLILMDIKMPVMDGHTATKLIKAFRPDLPIFAQTAYALESEKAIFLNDFDDYITKPINQRDLKQKLKKYIDNERTV
jgi:CheY-like chemotaxis protein